MKHAAIILVAACVFTSRGAAPAASGRFENFLYTSAGESPGIAHLLDRSDIGGAQVVYPWRRLEVGKDRYDFSPIENDVAILKAHRKKLFIQVQDRFFSPEARYVPDYLMTEAVYGGGLVAQKDNPGENKPQVSGWVAQQWSPRCAADIRGF